MRKTFLKCKFLNVKRKPVAKDLELSHLSHKKIVLAAGMPDLNKTCFKKMQILQINHFSMHAGKGKGVLTESVHLLI